jgi:hypothetical protein
MKAEQSITYISIAVIAVSLFFIGTQLTGFATTNDTAVVNVTVDTSAEIIFTTDFLNFGSGAVTPGTVAVLDSEGTVTNGDWAPVSGELVLENIGNINVTLELMTDKLASDFIGGSANQNFEAKVTDYAGNGGNTGACTGTQAFSSYHPINTTLQTACGTAFGYTNVTDEIMIDFNMTIPDDATGSRTITITAVGTYA